MKISFPLILAQCAYAKKKKKRHFSGSVACWGTRGEGPWMCQNTLWKFQRAESLGNLLFLWKNVTGEMGDWHHKGPKIARAATHCQTRFRLRRWLLFCEVSGPEKKIGGVEIANYFFLLDMHRSRSKPHECPAPRSSQHSPEDSCSQSPVCYRCCPTPQKPRILNAASPPGHVIGLEIISTNLQKQITWQGLEIANNFSIAGRSKAGSGVTRLRRF